MLRIGALTVGILTAVASVALAQGPGGPGGPGVLFGRGGMRMSSGMLLRMAEVQTELGITDDQKKEIETASNEMRDKMRASFGQINFQDFQTMSQEERDKKIAEIQTKMEDFNKQIDEKAAKLLTAKQLERLNQLKLQADGAAALTRPEVIAKLKFSDDQLAKIKKIIEDSAPKFDPNQSQEERRAAFSKVRENRDKALKDALAVLDDDQLMDWGGMRGKDFKFPANMGRGFGRRGGGQGGQPGQPPAGGSNP